ncbi:MAG TPA: 16S rRNA (cytosine(1402)-N(4))-methyltransferase RsmH [Rickettsiales bacterium]|nr:16S rRNA (cytosine(1402)-N(4))-methyltransferase RsmH [Rickettsiales bacterium]
MKNFENHIPVMLKEVLQYLNPKSNELYADCTFGAGGYTEAILKQANCSVIGLDRDSSVQEFANKIKKDFQNRFEFYNVKFSDIENILNGRKLDGMVLDIGVSSMQIDNADRGFSFQKDSKLDMRMGNNSLSAYDIVNNSNEQELANIIYNYGDEVKSRHIAKKIIEKRKEKPIETTFELADIVRYFYPKREGKIDPATKTFQAIRIAVNDELSELKKILELSKKILNKNGRLVVVSFHSLEDEIVKGFVKKETNKGIKKDKYSKDKNTYNFNLLTKKVVVPTEEEVRKNVRARSAKLRALQKC